MSPDPMGGTIMNPQSLNGYTYVQNNPETFVDPLGLFTSNPTFCQLDPDLCNGGGGGGGGNGGPCSLRTVRGGQSYGTILGNNFDAVAGGCGVGGGGGGGGPKQQASPSSKKQAAGHPYLTRVVNSGNEASLQGILQGLSGGRLGNGWLASAFLGNPISGALQFFFGGGTPATGAAIKAAAPAALKRAPNVAVSYTSTTVNASPSEFTAITNEINVVLPLGDIATGAAEVLGGFTKLVQLPVDITATGFGAVVCAAGPAGD